MRQQTFVTESVAGGGILVYLDMDHVGHDGRVSGIVKFYDMRYTGDAPRGSQGQGFTVDGQFISAHYPEDLTGEVNVGLILDGGVPSWSLGVRQHRAVRMWISLVYQSQEDTGDTVFPKFVISTYDGIKGEVIEKDEDDRSFVVKWEDGTRSDESLDDGGQGWREVTSVSS